LTTAARSIAEIITSAGYQNIDFEDVRTVMSNAGTAVLGSAQKSGDDRALRAVKDALASPLLDNRDIEGAEHLLVSMSTSREHELTSKELQNILSYLRKCSGTEANLIWGQSYDATLGEDLRVTVIATGFDKLPGQIHNNENDYERGPFLALDSAEKTTPIVLDPTPSKIYSGGTPSPYAELRTPPQEPKPEMPSWHTAPSQPPRQESAPVVVAMPPIPAPDVPVHNLSSAETSPLFFDGRQLPLPPSGPQLPPQEPAFLPPAGTEVPRPGFMSGIGAPSRPAFTPSGPSDDQISLEEKKRMFAERLARRKEALANNGQQARPTLDFNRLDEPAYKRHNIDVRDQVAPLSPIISRVTLTEDNELNKNNRYLDDNVC
jgi:cell division protein FtsZ